MKVNRVGIERARAQRIIIHSQTMANECDFLLAVDRLIASLILLLMVSVCLCVGVCVSSFTFDLLLACACATLWIIRCNSY